MQTVLSDLLTTFQPGGWWQAGMGAASAGLGYVFEQENLLEAVLRIPSGLTGSWRWQTDQTALPWKLSLQPMSDEIACEMRLRRNLTGLRVSVNRDELCTVMVPLGKDGLTIAEVNGGSDSLIAESAATWGRVERIYRDAREDDPAALKAAAQRALSHLCAPLVTVEAEGLALKHLTGEAMDGLHLGDVCRVALPETGETLLERIVSLRWEDVLHAPGLRLAGHGHHRAVRTEEAGGDPIDARDRGAGLGQPGVNAVGIGVPGEQDVTKGTRGQRGGEVDFIGSF